MKQSELIVLIVIAIILVLFVIWLISKKRVHERNAFRHHTATTMSKSETLPTFMRHDNRIIVTAKKVRAEDRIDLPATFDTRIEYPGWITEVKDQGACGSCWSFSSSGVFGDRIRISSKGVDMPVGDSISPHHLAACMKCGGAANVVCQKVCSGHYMDEVLDYLKQNGAYSVKSIKDNTSNGDQYICFKPTTTQKARLYKASDAYRVNPYSIDELSIKSKRSDNEYAIMYDIYKYGPVTATIKVFDPLKTSDLHRNLYLYETGIYGTNWGKADPKETDGYHAIGIIGWGEQPADENTSDQDVRVYPDGRRVIPYWIIRNSWGPEWGQNGYGKILRGSNRIIIESDLWAMHY